MLENVSVKALYPLALAEGEGVGTAYEYFAKRLALGRWLKGHETPGKILIAGLPEKYGSSLDFFFLAHELQARLVVVDERPAALSKAQEAVAAAQSQGLLSGIEPEYLLVSDLVELPDAKDRPDLVLSSETLQRLPAGRRLPFWHRLQVIGPAYPFSRPTPITLHIPT